MTQDTAPVGVFDSGMGGLTVLRALEAALPGESFIYLGDTARLPYGSKSPGTVARYALQASEILVERGIRALVVACNTASAFALDALVERHPELPVFGVVEPGALAAAQAPAGASVLVLATESTVAGGAYQKAILRLRPDLKVHARACPLLVALAEEGEHSGEFCERVIGRYLHGHVAGGSVSQPATVVLGCTHFPVFRVGSSVAGAHGAGGFGSDHGAASGGCAGARIRCARRCCKGTSDAARHRWRSPLPAGWRLLPRPSHRGRGTGRSLTQSYSVFCRYSQRSSMTHAPQRGLRAVQT